MRNICLWKTRATKATASCTVLYGVSCLFCLKGAGNEAGYKTTKGAYFIAGEGGAMTGYARSCGTNSTCEGSGIRVLSEAEAMEWLENHAGTEALEQYFNDKIEEA